jgi:hypothetical protein
MRASLRLRDFGHTDLADTSRAAEWLTTRGVTVLRAGKRAFSVEAEPDVMASALHIDLRPGQAAVLPIDQAAALGRWFDLIEVAPQPLQFGRPAAATTN